MPGEGKEILLQLPKEAINVQELVQEAHNLGIRSVVLSGRAPEGLKGKGLRIYSPSKEADVYITKGLSNIEYLKASGKPFALSLRVEKPGDIDVALEASSMGAAAIFVETGDWRIIPLENIIAELHKRDTKVFARAQRVEEIGTLLGVLELGVDGVVFAAGAPEALKRAVEALRPKMRLSLGLAKVMEVRDVGMGDRVCVDTASILNLGEGLLVGSKAGFLFLVHNESIGSDFTSPRPFRVNAGSVHSYVLLPDGRTRYLSEVKAGDEVLVVNNGGGSRTAVVGRAKIERRPLRLLEAMFEEQSGTILVQNAETIRFVGRDGRPISATEVRTGDEVLVHVGGAAGRHFGLEVEEFVLEK